MMPLAVALLLAFAVAAVGCGEEGEVDSMSGGTADALAGTHVHALSVAPDSDALLIATHQGLFRLGDGGLERVGDLRDDFMGFAVADSSTFVASGHPAPPGGGESPHLGLISSSDGGGAGSPSRSKAKPTSTLWLRRAGGSMDTTALRANCSEARMAGRAGSRPSRLARSSTWPSIPPTKGA